MFDLQMGTSANKLEHTTLKIMFSKTNQLFKDPIFPYDHQSSFPVLLHSSSLHSSLSDSLHFFAKSEAEEDKKKTLRVFYGRFNLIGY